ncbi:MAG TPA: cation-efflux pump [Oribacterium sp.]|nr:cation-efflux pump [Oribacterium sp.]
MLLKHSQGFSICRGRYESERQKPPAGTMHARKGRALSGVRQGGGISRKMSLLDELTEETNMNEHTRRIRISERAGFTGIVCNLLLFVFKISIGLIINSVSIMADGFNNLSDAGSSVISVIGSKMAGKKADEDHPFGHGRIEYIAAFIVSILVLNVGLSSLKDAFQKILHPEVLHYSMAAVVILLASMAVKLGLALFYRHVAAQIDSNIYRASSQDAFMDILTTATTFASLLIFHFCSWNIDAYVGLLVSLIVLWNGVGIARETLAPLIGDSIDPELFYTLIDFVESYPGILGSHDLIVHNYGPNQYMATIHAEVDGKSNIESAHDLVDQIEHDCETRLGVHLVIHMDPVNNDDETRFYRALLENVLSSLSPESSFHDFRLRHELENAPASEKHGKHGLPISDGRRADERRLLYLVFDLVTPWNFTKEEETQLLHGIQNRMQIENPEVRCIIQLDKPYMHTHSEREDQEARARATQDLKEKGE